MRTWRVSHAPPKTIASSKCCPSLGFGPTIEMGTWSAAVCSSCAAPVGVQPAEASTISWPEPPCGWCNVVWSSHGKAGRRTTLKKAQHTDQVAHQIQSVGTFSGKQNGLRAHPSTNAFCSGGDKNIPRVVLQKFYLPIDPAAAKCAEWVETWASFTVWGSFPLVSLEEHQPFSKDYTQTLCPVAMGNQAHPSFWSG